jgi:tRNA-specific adenosine deaminase 3
VDDEWGGLSHIEQDAEELYDDFSLGSNTEGLVPENKLPFVRLKLIDDEAEDELSSVQTGNHWKKYCT